MSFVDSVFGSSSKTKKKTTTNTNITNTTTTTTTNKTGDIGLTGKHAVNLANVLGTSSTNQLSKSLAFGNDALKYAAGLSTVNQAENASYAKELLRSTSDASKSLLSTAKMQSESIISSGLAKSQTENKYLIPYILIGIVGVIFAMKGLK